MKKAILSSILLLSTTSIFAQTTMCFKENHNSMSTIESIPLNGGACEGKNSIADMKAKGWQVDDIKISQSEKGMNFIYILKTPSSITDSSTQFTNSADMEARIVAKLEKKKEEEIKAKEIKRQIDLAAEGEAFYVKKCQSCHGTNGETKAKGYSRPLNTLSSEEMMHSISGYTNGTYDRGLANIMRPIAGTVTYEIIDKVHAYIQKVNNK